jgi:hypothetical protein
MEDVMQQYDSWTDLERRGIGYLTGEACGLSMRLLCDVNERGRKTVETFLRCKLVDDSNWNTTVDGEPAVASVMLPCSIFVELAAFAHVEQTGFPVRIISQNGRDEEAIGMEEGDDQAMYNRVETVYPGRWVSKSTHPGTGIDNRHAMSSRLC